MSKLTFFSLLFYPWLLSSAFFTYTSLASIPVAKPGCPIKCGNVSIYYPFGIGVNKACSLSNLYAINCNTSYDPPKPFFGTTNLEIFDMSITGQMRISNNVVTKYFQGGELIQSKSIGWASKRLRYYPVVFSNTNKFILIGCDDYAFFGTLQRTYRSGCAAGCSKRADVINGACTGIGCCQTSIPKGLRNLEVDVYSFNNHTNVSSFNPYSFAFVGEEDKFTFNVRDLNDPDFVNRIEQNIPKVLEWFVGGNQTCLQAKRNMSAYACQNNSNCTDFDAGPGYRCSCLPGYEGNPCLSPGCTDFNECANATTRVCSDICTNIPGSYKCSCPKGYQGDGLKNGNGCTKPSNATRLTLVVLSSTLGSALLVLLGWWLNAYIKKKKSNQAKSSIL